MWFVNFRQFLFQKGCWWKFSKLQQTLPWHPSSLSKHFSFYLLPVENGKAPGNRSPDNRFIIDQGCTGIRGLVLDRYIRAPPTGPVRADPGDLWNRSPSCQPELRSVELDHCIVVALPASLECVAPSVGDWVVFDALFHKGIVSFRL